MKTYYDCLIVGAGLSGLTIARLLTDFGKSVLVLEKREKIGGNVSTYVEDKIVVHQYGPHIFHTSDEFAWSFFNKYVEVYSFVNSPLANYRGELYHLPFNMNTFHEIWGVNTPEEAKAKIKEEVDKEHIAEPKNLEEQALSMVGRTIYEKLIKEYTEKQWGRNCKELPPDVIKRLPLRYEYNNNYFNDKYQGLPKGGYQVLCENLAKDIDVLINTDYLEDKGKWNSIADVVIYTGQLDAFFDYSFGCLDWRSLRFENEKHNQNFYQDNPVINFTSHEFPYTRIAEHKRFDPHCVNNESTIITKEYPDKYEIGKIPYYPIKDRKNDEVAKKYLSLAKTLEPKLYLLGRLAKYEYLDMDDSIIEAKALFDLLVIKCLNNCKWGKY